jgi:hypothetical protein
MSSEESSMQGQPRAVPETSIAREILAGLIGTGVSLVCVLPPLLHLVTGPLGPFIGAFVVAHHVRPGTRGRAIIAGIMGACLAGLGAAVVAAMTMLGGKGGPPSWLPSSDALGMILAGVFMYATALAAAGAAFGATFTREKRAPDPERSP